MHYLYPDSLITEIHHCCYYLTNTPAWGYKKVGTVETTVVQKHKLLIQSKASTMEIVRLEVFRTLSSRKNTFKIFMQELKECSHALIKAKSQVWEEE